MAFNDYWRTWKATLPKTAGGSTTQLPDMTITEAPLSPKGMLVATTSPQNRSKGIMLQEPFLRTKGSHTETIAKGKYQQRRVKLPILGRLYHQTFVRQQPPLLG